MSILKNKKFSKIGQIVISFLLAVALVSLVTVVIAAPDSGGQGDEGNPFLRLYNKAVSVLFSPPEQYKKMYEIDNQTTKDYFVPLKTQKEWDSFKDNIPSNVFIRDLCPFASNSCIPLNKECYTNEVCVMFNVGYDASNCRFNGLIEKFEPTSCCIRSEVDGCFLNPIPGGCQVNPSTNTCEMKTRDLNNNFDPMMWDYSQTANHCSRASTINTCFGSSHQDHCSYSCASVLCSSKYQGGTEVYIDPDIEVCCNFSDRPVAASAPRAALCDGPGGGGQWEIPCRSDDDCTDPQYWCANIPGICAGSDPHCHQYNNNRLACENYRPYWPESGCYYIASDFGYCELESTPCTDDKDCPDFYSCEGVVAYCKSVRPVEPGLLDGCERHQDEEDCYRSSECMWYIEVESGLCQSIFNL